ncbi:hypothetical protein TWF281_011181 [Arthrobotrys megalospora]
MKRLLFIIAFIPPSLADLVPRSPQGVDRADPKDGPPKGIQLPNVFVDVAGPGQIAAWKASYKEQDEPPPVEGIDDRLVLFNGCEIAMKNKIIGAFSDARIMMEIPIKDGKGFQIDWNRPAAVEMFGSPARTRKYHDTILANIRNVVHFFFDTEIREKIWVRCDDPLKQCSSRNPDSLAYVPLYDNSQKDNMYIAFCPAFRWVRNLSDLLKRPGQIKPVNRNLDDWRNGGKTFLHAIFHMPHVSTTHRDILTHYPENDILQILDVTVKDDDKYRSGVPARTPYLARLLAAGGNDQPAVFPSSNAETYAQYLLAEFAHKHDGYYPFQPALEEKWPWSRRCDGDIGPEQQTLNDQPNNDFENDCCDPELGIEFEEYTKEQAIDICKRSNGTVALFFNNGTTILRPGECLQIVGPDNFVYGSDYTGLGPAPDPPDRIPVQRPQ